MPYDARKISNFLLDHCARHEYPLTNLRINKLLYFVHGWYLTRDTRGIVRNHFEAWTFGPVVRVVFNDFKIFGEEPISSPAEFLDYSTGKVRPVDYDDMSYNDMAIVARVADYYRQFSTGRLVKEAHAPGGPWDTVLQAISRTPNKSPRIPNDLIRHHFLKMIVENDGDEILGLGVMQRIVRL